MKILLVTGGKNSERKISLLSAFEVKKALIRHGYDVKIFDLKKGTRQLAKKARNYNLVFPVIHGEEGEGGNLQKLLARLKVPFVGGNWKGFKKGWYKLPLKRHCQKNKILTPHWQILNNKNDILNFGFPCVLKSDSGGSSLEVAVLKSANDVNSPECRKLLKSSHKLFVEHFLSGVEVTVGILEDKVIPVMEIIPPKGEWFNYENKYNNKTSEIANAPSLTQEQRNDCQRIALDIHQKLDLGPYSRVDFIFSDNQPYVLEINTIPGLTPESVFPKAAQAAGFSFEQMIEKLVQSALSKKSI